MKKQKTVDLTGRWLVRRKLTPALLQKLLILARAADLQSWDNNPDSWYISWVEGHPYFGVNEIGDQYVMDMYSENCTGKIKSYTYTEVVRALVQKIKKNVRYTDNVK